MGRRAKAWSTREADAGAIVFDANHVAYPAVVYDTALRRNLFMLGHYSSGRPEDLSIGRVWLFEARHPWGPWAAVGYYDDWGSFGPSASGTYLALHMPLEWLSRDGTTLWCIFSGLRAFDPFNLVKGSLKARIALFLP